MSQVRDKDEGGTTSASDNEEECGSGKEGDVAGETRSTNGDLEGIVQR